MAQHPLTRLQALARREIATVVSTRAFGLFVVSLAGLLAGLVWVSGAAASGYLPTAVDLLPALELLVPLLSFTVGYRALLDDRRRGELAVLSTFPVSRATVVASVLVGRGIALAVGIVAALLPTMALVWVLGEPTTLLVATHSSTDSVVLFMRLLSATTLFGLAALSVAIAVSAVASGTRHAAGALVGLWIALTAVVDLGLVEALGADLVGTQGVLALLALSPSGAYRGLVLQTVVDVATGGTLQAAAPLASVAGLLAWIGGGFAVATRSVWQE
ncbi:ABC transporter permease [Halorientalis brevis]|uniref:ABC transporter permease n=1 Tax=Halorientalis brevis TaxID=1126241 RepID=A0ABD6CDX3_9EURY|nr:ABC transporter permease subunit [Halorientalis brevis]